MHAQRRAQGVSLSEYALVIGAVTLAVGAMTVYAQRGLQARLRFQADDLLRIEEGDVNGEITQRKGAQLLSENDLRRFPDAMISAGASNMQSTTTRQQSGGDYPASSAQTRQQGTQRSIAFYQESRGQNKSKDTQPK